MSRINVGSSFRAALGWCAALVVAVAMARARELDPAACGARFDVQRDKIIRTEESREMGARYLSELDVGARHECLRLCCETDSCDVFVYEEKSPGSCYLFSCGPPEDFRCKFTAHGNFSSGVLALSRRLAELQDQERLAHHEQQLANLRGASAPSTPAATTAPTTAAPAATAPAPPPRPPDPPPGRCSRYQFECRHGGECIAVYNACDGVPQCADGSDEAPELGCPAPAPRPPPPATTPPTPPPPPPQLKPMQVLGEPPEAEVSGAAVAELAPPERWPHRLAQAQPPPPPHRYNAAEAGRGPHIFSHKGGLLQEEAPYAPFEPPAPAPAPAPSPWARRLWPQPHQGVEWGAGGGGGGGWGEPDPRRAWPVPPRQEMPVYALPKTMPELPLEYGPAAEPALRDEPKKRPPPPSAPPPAPPAPARPHQEHHHEAAAAAAVAAAGASASTSASASAGAGAPSSAGAAAPLAAAADERDGLSDHPPSAILLLVLGVGMTAVLGALVACRARAARRRGRRGKSPLAHDADYLVNGMYL